LQHHRAKLRERTDQLGGQGAHALDADNLRVGGGGGFEFQVRRGCVALSAELDQAAFAARGQELLDRLGLLRVALVRAALVAGREAHLHLGVDATGVGGVGVQLLGTATQQEELERLVGKALG
jgi:hypothetical protein